MRTIQHWIGGTPTSGASTRTAPVWNPATGQRQADVLLAEASDVDSAVSVAAKAFEQWRDASLSRLNLELLCVRDARHQQRYVEALNLLGSTTPASALTSLPPPPRFAPPHPPTAQP